MNRALLTRWASHAFFGAVVTSWACGATGDAATPEPARPAESGAQEIRDDADEIPCGPRSVLRSTCQKCHSQPPTQGAPFALVTLSDIVATRSGSVVRDLMIEQLAAGRMPLTPVTLDPVEREVLLAWLRAGAQPGPRQSCDDAGASDADAGDPRAADAADIDADAAPVEGDLDAYPE